MKIPDYRPGQVQSLGRPNIAAGVRSAMSPFQAAQDVMRSAQVIEEKNRDFEWKQNSQEYEAEVNELRRQGEGKAFYRADEIPEELLAGDKYLQKRVANAKKDADGNFVADIPKSAVWPQLHARQKKELIKKYKGYLTNKQDSIEWEREVSSRLDRQFTEDYIKGVDETLQHYREIDQQNIEERVLARDFDQARAIADSYDGDQIERQEILDMIDYQEERSSYLDTVSTNWEEGMIASLEYLMNGEYNPETGEIEQSYLPQRDDYDSEKDAYVQSGGNLNPDQRDAMIHHLMGHLGHLHEDKKAGAGYQKKLFLEEMKVTTRQLNSVEKVSPERISYFNSMSKQLLDSSDLTPSEYWTVEKYRVSLVTKTFGDMIMDRPMSERQQLIDDMKDDPELFWTKFHEINPVMAGQLEQGFSPTQRSMIPHELDSQNKKWFQAQQKDSIGYALDRGLYGAQHITFDQWSGEDIGMTLRHRLKTWGKIREGLNSDSGLLSEVEAKEFGQYWDNASLDERTYLSTVIQESLGESSPLFYAKMSGILPNAYITHAELQSSGMADVGRSVIKGAEIRKDPEFRIEDYRTIRNEVANEIAPAYSGSRMRLERMTESVLDFAVQFERNNGGYGDIVSSEAIEEGIRQVTGVINFEGYNVLPAYRGQTSGDLEDWFDSRTPEFYEAQPDGRAVNPQDGLAIKGHQIKESIDDGDLRLVSRGYGVWHLEQPRGSGSLSGNNPVVLNVDGSPYTIYYTEEFGSQDMAKATMEKAEQEQLISEEQAKQERKDRIIKNYRKSVYRRMNPDGTFRSARTGEPVADDEALEGEVALQVAIDEEAEREAERAQKRAEERERRLAFDRANRPDNSHLMKLERERARNDYKRDNEVNF